MATQNFELRCPSAQTAVDVFAGKWTSDLSKVSAVVGTGQMDLFVADERPKLAAEALGVNGRLDGMRVLEIGPLEGAHSYQLEQLGATVVGIETNKEAFLRCLVLKEALELKKTSFKLGDATKFMALIKDKFDVVFCSGVLYHMRDPISFIGSLCKTADKCFIWTHYYNDERGNFEAIRTRRTVDILGFRADYYELKYQQDRGSAEFLGGNEDIRAWMTLSDIVACLKYFGLKDVSVLRDDPHVQIGATAWIAASR